MMNGSGGRRRRRNKNKDKNLHHQEEISEISASNCDTGNNNNTINGVDKISQLPDDILISIISRLTVAEAVSTSILSTRWRGLHKYITRLDFYPTAKQLHTKYNKFYHRGEEFLTNTYASAIDHTLDTHNTGAFLQEFRLHLPNWVAGDRPRFADYKWPIGRRLIERWLDFAYSKQVQIVYLNVNCTYHEFINFPFVPSIKNSPSFKTLKELSIRGFDVNDGVFELLLSNFVSLERLSIEYGHILDAVRGCQKRGDIRMFGDSMGLKLKHLNLTCWVESVEIRDMMNLESLRCTNCRQILLENLPRLAELDTCTRVGVETLSRDDNNNVIIRDQLVKLKLSSFRWMLYIYELPKMVNLKHLELDCAIYRRRDFDKLIRLIDVCPCLQILEIKLTRRGGEQYCTREVKRASIEHLITRWGGELVKGASNEHLKRVKISGIFGWPDELELASYIVRKATALEELVMEICPNKYDRTRRRARARVRQHFRPAPVWQHFRPILPDSVNFVLV